MDNSARMHSVNISGVSDLLGSLRCAVPPTVIYHGYSPAEQRFEELEKLFTLQETSVYDKFTISCPWLTGKATTWVKLNMTRGTMSTCQF